MNGIDLLINEHKYVSRMLVVIRKVCFNLMENNEIDYEDFDKIKKKDPHCLTKDEYIKSVEI